MNLIEKTKLFFARRKSKKEKAVADDIQAPYIKVLNIGFEDDNVTQGYFELDWNDLFVQELREAGYGGQKDEDVVNLWFNDLCRSVASEQENA